MTRLLAAVAVAAATFAAVPALAGDNPVVERRQALKQEFARQDAAREPRQVAQETAPWSFTLPSFGFGDGDEDRTERGPVRDREVRRFGPVNR